MLCVVLVEPWSVYNLDDVRSWPFQIAAQAPCLYQRLAAPIAHGEELLAAGALLVAHQYPVPLLLVRFAAIGCVMALFGRHVATSVINSTPVARSIEGGRIEKIVEMCRCLDTATARYVVD